MGTYNHGWNAPNTILSQYIAGVAPVEAGWKTYHVKPQLGSLTAVQVRVPSVLGNIDIDIRMPGERFAMKLNSPRGTTAIVGVPMNSSSVKRVSANGKVVWNGRFVAGQTGVMWKGGDDDYHLFAVAPGEWTFLTQ